MKNGKKTIGTLTHLRSTSAIEAMGVAGMDYVMLDMEHCPADVSEVNSYILAAKAYGMDALVRVPELSKSNVLRVLDAGASGVVVPGIETVSQVKELVGYGKFAPLGDRGYCMTRDGKWGFGSNYQEGLEGYMKWANEETLLLPQCETRGCLEHIEEIVAMDGVDGVLIGPYDLSLGMGLGGNFDSPEFVKAVERIRRACEERGKICIMFTGDENQIGEKMEQGFDSLLFGLDVLGLIGYYKGVAEKFNKYR